MAIKIECAQCGFRNDLGRVFCTQCGQKLDMNRTSMSDMKGRREFEIGKLLRTLVGWLVTLTVVVGLGLAFWPPVPAPLLFDQAGVQQVPSKMAAVKRTIAARRKGTLDFAEGEVNGYLAARAQSRKLAALTVDLKPGRFNLEAKFSWQPSLTNLPWLSDLKIPIHCGLTGGFVDGALVVKQARIGHLPLFGRAMAPVQSFFAKIFHDVIAEKSVVDALTQVSIDDVKVSVSVGK
jgi:hypothetical protein